MRIIGLVGAKGAGKTTASKYLVQECGFISMRFADALKAMMRALGLTEAQIEGDEKEVPCALLGGRTPRWAMQSLGTEWGRHMISHDLWANVTRQSILAAVLHDHSAKIVLDDCRFPNEQRLLTGLGAEVWAIRRPAVEPTPNAVERWLARRGWNPKLHVSELHWRTFAADYVVDNGLGVDHLHRQLSAALRQPMRIPVIPCGAPCCT